MVSHEFKILKPIFSIKNIRVVVSVRIFVYLCFIVLINSILNLWMLNLPKTVILIFQHHIFSNMNTILKNIKISLFKGIGYKFDLNKRLEPMGAESKLTWLNWLKPADLITMIKILMAILICSQTKVLSTKDFWCPFTGWRDLAEYSRKHGVCLNI